MAYSNAIFYVDLYNGNDAARAALTGCIASNPGGTITRITKAAHGLVTGAVVDLTLFTTWLNGAWKITVVDANSFDLDGAAWQATADANGTVTPRGGSSWADAWKTMNYGPTAVRIAAGDEIRTCKTPDPVEIGSATFTNRSKNVTLANARTETITQCEAAFTASANVTCATSTIRKQGALSASIAILAAFTTGKAAYYSLPSSLNLSSFQTLSFQLHNSVAITSALSLRVCLCSDTLGNTVVDDFKVPLIAATGRFCPFNLSRVGGGNLGANINSVAVYADFDQGAITILIDNIIACRTGDLNLTSLLSKNGTPRGGVEGYFALQSIDGVNVMIDNSTGTMANAGRGYSGVSETTTIYTRESFKTGYNGSTFSAFSTQAAGTSSSFIIFTGGWNPTSGAADGETFFDGLTGLGKGVEMKSSYVELSDYTFSFFRYDTGAYVSASDQYKLHINNCGACSSYGYYIYGNIISGSSCATRNANNNGGAGFYNASVGSHALISVTANSNLGNGAYFKGLQYIEADVIKCCNNSAAGLQMSECDLFNIKDLIVENNLITYGFYIMNCGSLSIRRGRIVGDNTGSAIYSMGICHNVRLFNTVFDGFQYVVKTTAGRVTLSGCTISYISAPTIHYALHYSNGETVLHNTLVNGVVTDRVYVDRGANIELVGLMNGELEQKSLLFSNIQYATKYKLAEASVNIGKVVTVSCNMMQSTNTGAISVTLFADYNPFIGSDEDVCNAEVTGVYNEQLELMFTFTPIASGVVEIYIKWSGASSFNIYNLNITQ